MSVIAGSTNLPTNMRFRLEGRGGGLYSLVTCVCLYRAVDPVGMTAQYLVLTKDKRFAHVEAVIGDKGVRPAIELTRERAIRFLVEHGEGDLVEEFPDIFREETHAHVRAPQANADGSEAVAPKDRPTEPYLFPLH